RSCHHRRAVSGAPHDSCRGHQHPEVLGETRMIDALPWLVLFLPLGSAFTIVLITSWSRRISSWISVATVCICFVGSCILFAHPNLNPATARWINLWPMLDIPFAFVLDRLSKTMLVLVTGVG